MLQSRDSVRHAVIFKRNLTKQEIKISGWFVLLVVMALSCYYSDNDRRILNNKLQSLERAFIFPDGLPNRPFFK